MRSALIGVVAVALVLGELWILNMDLWLPLGGGYVLSSNPREPSDSNLLFGSEHTEITNVLRYTVLGGGTIVGEEVNGFFIADSAGRISTFTSEREWRDACYRLTGEEPGVLRKPSHLDTTEFWKWQLVLAAVAVILAVMILCRHELVRRE